MTSLLSAGPKQDDDEFDAQAASAKSKSQIKREWRALLPLARELTALPERQLRAMPLSESLMEAVVLARSLSRGALQRQLRYGVGLLAREDHEAIAAALEAVRRPQRAAVETLHEVESWREALIDGDTAVFTELIRRFPSLDRQHVARLVRASQKERAGQHASRAARQLYKYLSGLIEGGSA